MSLISLYKRKRKKWTVLKLFYVLMDNEIKENEKQCLVWKHKISMIKKKRRNFLKK